MFTRIYYDSYKNRLYCIEKNNGKRTKIDFRPKFEYYVPDPSGNSEFKDIYGNSVTPQISESRKDMKLVAESVQTCETDISEDVKFLQKRYKGKKLKADMNNFQVATIDIEVKSEKEFPKADQAKFPINLISIHYSQDDQVYTFGTSPYTGNSPIVKNYHYCEDEKTMIERFIKHFRRKQVDILTGWNCIAGGEFIWLDNKIIKIENIKEPKELYKYGKIKNFTKSGLKKKNEIILKNGLNIFCSDEHIFPIYTKNKNEYKNKNSLLKNFKDASLNEIKEISKEQDVFLKIDIRENKNNDYTYRNLICENIEKILSYNIVDVIINDKEILRKIKKEKKLTYKSLDVKKRTNIWSYKNNEDILSLGELKNYLSNSNEIIFLFGKGKRKRKYVISNLDENISLEDLRLLGFAFTDGSFYNKKIISFYNNDISNIEYYNDLIYKRLKRYNKTKNKNFGKINSKYEKSWRKRMSFFNDFFFLTILVTDNNFNKNIDIEILSKLSYNQFLSFYGGCLDGDGYIQEYAVSLCNYENNIKKIVNLLMWNGCLVNQNENYVSIPSNEFNRKFIENIEIKHSKRKIKKQNLSFKEIKNSISKDIKWFIYDDFAVVNIKEIKEYDDYVNMFDMKTETSYFSCNGIKTHNCMSFDVPYIINRCKNLGIELSLSPINQYKERRTGGYHIDGGGYTIAGISILDGLELYKNFVYTKRERYSLQFIGKLEVEEGKKDLEGTVNTAWKQWNEFVEYNIQDVLLCKKIEDKKKHIQLTINFCYQALIPFDRIFSSISVVTGYMLRYLHERNIVFPDKTNHTKDKKFPGAYVMAKPGYYEWLVSFDIASMYPHLIMQYNISPETLVLNPESEKGLLKCPLSQWKKWETAEGDYECGGIYYRKDKKGILAEIVEDIYNDRKKFKSKEFIANAIEKNMSLEKYNNEMINIVKDENESSEYYYSQQQIRKILINSIYGVLGNPYFNFFNINNAIAVTLSGQHLIRYLSDTINSYMKSSWHKVGPKLFPDYKGKWNPLKKDVCILVDTDSNYLCLEEIIKDMGLDKEFAKDYQKFLDWVLFMENNFFNPFFNKILNIYAAKFGVEQKMVFKREKIITQKFILAKKKYADEIIANEDDYLNKEGIPYTKKPKISITGIEVVRTDTPQFSRDRIMGVIKKIFEVRGKNKDLVVNRLREIHDEFLEAKPKDIAKPTGIKDYQKYAEPVQKYVEKRKIDYPKHVPMHVRAAMNYNFTIAKHHFPFMEVDNGTKMKYIYVAPHKNELHQNIIGFINEWPEEFDDLFFIDVEEQWIKVFQGAIQRFFDVLKWGKIELEQNTLEDFIQF